MVVWESAIRKHSGPYPKLLPEYDLRIAKSGKWLGQDVGRRLADWGIVIASNAVMGALEPLRGEDF